MVNILILLFQRSMSNPVQCVTTGKYCLVAPILRELWAHVQFHLASHSHILFREEQEYNLSVPLSQERHRCHKSRRTDMGQEFGKIYATEQSHSLYVRKAKILCLNTVK